MTVITEEEKKELEGILQLAEILLENLRLFLTKCDDFCAEHPDLKFNEAPLLFGVVQAMAIVSVPLKRYTAPSIVSVQGAIGSALKNQRRK